MNFNLYLDRESAAVLNRLAKAKKSPRNALIRQAVHEWLGREASQWPVEVLTYKGNAGIPPFEAYRGELTSPIDDPLLAKSKRRSLTTRNPRKSRD